MGARLYFFDGGFLSGKKLKNGSSSSFHNNLPIGLFKNFEPNEFKRNQATNYSKSLIVAYLSFYRDGISVVPTTTMPRKLKVRKSTRVDAHKVGPSRPHKDRRSIKQKKKEASRILTGAIHVQSSFNNTIVTITDVEGRVFSWSSFGSCKFENTKKGTPFAAQTAAEDAIRKAVDRGLKRAKVMIKGPGLGRDTALRATQRSGVRISIVRDVTPMPHNGCRPPKKRRV
ncbi:uncharacterized protein LOC113315717 [Papaver somniferum]|uniref:uncharacterized protein LOC113315717 n=1 Tax=Papaver somniferum TaxID=3469 RepID=UPI000E6F4869|nr:uncharacterized protein LOC113315717 [Papaver somniferum]